MEELKMLLERYMASWETQDRAAFLDTLHPDIYLVECYGPSYRGKEECGRWWDMWHRDGRVTAWALRDTWYDPVKQTLFGTWEFHVAHKAETEPVFDGITLLQGYEGKIYRLFEYKAKHELFRPYEE